MYMYINIYLEQLERGITSTYTNFPDYFRPSDRSRGILFVFNLIICTSYHI